MNPRLPELQPRRRLTRPPRLYRNRLGWLALLGALAFTPLTVAAAAALTAGAVWLAMRATAAARRRLGSDRTDLASPRPVALGRDGRGAPVTLDDDQLGAHGLILGASGSGKSTTLVAITAQQIAAGRPVVVIDLKGSRDLERALGDAATAAGRRLRIWTPDGPEHWNPLAHGNPTELKDKLISTERFSEPHYQRAAERYVQIAAQVWGELHPGHEPSLGEVVAMLEPRRLQNEARRLPPPRAAQIGDYVRGLGADQLSAVRGLQSRLAVISEAHTGAFLEPAGDAIDLRQSLMGGDVVLFSLNASSYGRLSAQLGALVVQDLVTAAGDRERSGAAVSPAATVAIDEFSGLGADHVMALIARGRSAGISVLLATQELADLDRVSRGFRQQVIGSTAVKIAHRQDVPDSAQEIARLSGSEPVWERSYSREDGLFAGRGTARVTTRLVDRPRVDPSVIQSLRTGEAVVITKIPSARTRLTRIQPLGIANGSTRASGRER